MTYFIFLMTLLVPTTNKTMLLISRYDFMKNQVTKQLDTALKRRKRTKTSKKYPPPPPPGLEPLFGQVEGALRPEFLFSIACVAGGLVRRRKIRFLAPC